MWQSLGGFWPARVGGVENAMGGTSTGLALTKTPRRCSDREARKGISGGATRLNHEWTRMNPDFRREGIPSVRNGGGRM